MPFLIKRCTSADLLADLNHEVQELHAKAYPELFRPYSKPAVLKFFEWALSKDAWTHYVAYENELPIGFVQFERRKIEDHPFRKDCELIYIHQICISKTHERKGVGRFLINHVQKEGAKIGVKRIELDVWDQNSNAVEFFEHVGFKMLKHQMVMEAGET